MIKPFSVFSADRKPPLQEVQAHFDAHPELWDKNHPDYGKGPQVVDYITLLPRQQIPTPEEEAKLRRVSEILREFARTHKLPLIVQTTAPCSNHPNPPSR